MDHIREEDAVANKKHLERNSKQENKKKKKKELKMALCDEDHAGHGAFLMLVVAGRTLQHEKCSLVLLPCQKTTEN